MSGHRLSRGHSFLSRVSTRLNMDGAAQSSKVPKARVRNRLIGVGSYFFFWSPSWSCTAGGPNSSIELFWDSSQNMKFTVLH